LVEVAPAHEFARAVGNAGFLNDRVA